MDEERKRVWDVGLGAIGPLLTTLAIFIGIWQFNAGERNRTELENRLLIERDQIEFQRKLWLERLDTCRALSRVAGKIAAHEGNDPTFKKDLVEFRTAYWGQMILIEDPKVEKAMISFYDEIRDFSNGESDSDRLKVRAKHVVNSCRALIEAGTSSTK